MTSICRSCKAPVLWATMPSGRRIPLEREPVEPQPGKGLIAFDPRSGRGYAVSQHAFEQNLSGWRLRGFTVHKTHFASCPDAERFRVTA